MKSIVGWRLAGTWTVYGTLALLGACHQFALAKPQLPETIDIFTTSEYPIMGSEFFTATPNTGDIELKIHKVDGLKELEQFLSENLPNDKQQAHAVALDRLQSEVVDIRRLAHSGADALELAIRYQIDRYPAFVFNQGDSVIYGMTDVEQAISVYLGEGNRQ